MAYNLTLEAPRGILLPLDELQRIEEALREETKLDYLCELIMHFGGRQPRGHSLALSKYFENGVLSADEYEKFCTLHNLTPDRGETEADAAARLFLSYKWGQGIITASMPRDRDGILKAYRFMIDVARRHNLVIHDPQIGKDIDLDNPGELPPMYGPPPRPNRSWFSWMRSS